jgi:YidC/Oxa1 family membrane protein insertase
MWDSLVVLVRASIFLGANLLGGNVGAAVILISAMVRLGLIPLALRSARRARAQQAVMLKLAPQLQSIQKRHKADPRRLFAETQALYRANGVSPFQLGSFATMGVQIPLLGALFSAVRRGLGERVRFLWIADLSRADGVLIFLVATLSSAAAAIAPIPAGTPVAPRVIVGLAFVTSLLFLWSASSAVALSVGAGAATSAFQNWLQRREVSREATA